DEIQYISSTPYKRTDYAVPKRTGAGYPVSRLRPNALLSLDSAIQMSEERTVRLGSRQAWNSEDTQLCSCKVFFAVAGCFIGERTALRDGPGKRASSGRTDQSS